KCGGEGGIRTQGSPAPRNGFRVSGRRPAVSGWCHFVLPARVRGDGSYRLVPCNLGTQCTRCAHIGGAQARPAGPKATRAKHVVNSVLDRGDQMPGDTTAHAWFDYAQYANSGGGWLDFNFDGNANVNTSINGGRYRARPPGGLQVLLGTLTIMSMS